MADPRLIAILLDDDTILSPRAEVEAERRAAVADLLAGNRFEPRRSAAAGHPGPYRARVGIEDGRLAIAISDADGRALETVMLGMSRFRRPVRDYLAVRDSFLVATASGRPARIEPIDMARRALHNDGATLLAECLENKVSIDFETARRLFTLVATLHPRG